jgi:hypothetical protein
LAPRRKNGGAEGVSRQAHAPQKKAAQCPPRSVPCVCKMMSLGHRCFPIACPSPHRAARARTRDAPKPHPSHSLPTREIQDFEDKSS